MQTIKIDRRTIPQRRLRMAFVNPPHADWSLANAMTYLMCQSHYQHRGRYADYVDWIPAPYRWNRYQQISEVYQEIKDADIILFSSYAWNYTIIDDLARYARKQNPETILVLGGPHIGTHDPELMAQRSVYDFVCEPTKPGEPFVETLIDSWFENNHRPRAEDISWELSHGQGCSFSIDTEYSVYEQHLPYLKEILEYGRDNDIEPFIILETTRGCPYKCVFCEWGGGINTKIIKKSMEIVKRDILALIQAGFRDAYLTDANFGAFEERDIEIFRFAWSHDFNLTDISTVKARDLKRRMRLIDKWFEIVGQDKKRVEAENIWDAFRYSSLVPTVSLQSISDRAMEIARRVDLGSRDKLELSRYIRQRCQEQGFPVPALELILAMPGSTIDDFYQEMEIIWNFQAWHSTRHDYMFLPDSNLSDPDYIKEYEIETVEVYSDITDEDGIDNRNSLYRDRRTTFRTIRSCFSFSREEMIEMWIMNQMGNWLLENVYPGLTDEVSPGEFCRECYTIICQIPEFEPINIAVRDIFDPATPACSIRRIDGVFRRTAMESFLENNRLLLTSSLLEKVLV